MPKKISKNVKLIREFSKPEIDYTIQKSVSYSQFLSYNTCPRQWGLRYTKGLLEYRPSIHTVFGTALHEVIQEWLSCLYDETVKKATEMDLSKLLEEKLFTIYKQEKEKFGEHFSTSEQLLEFYNDGVEILKYIKRKRALFFNTKYVKLAGVEIPLIVEIKKNVYFKGYIDLLLYDEQDDKYIIIDIKTSTSGWNTNAKKDDKKIAQLLLYKEFLAKQFSLDVEKVEVQYFIVKRKVPTDPEYPAMARRVQEFIPASGKIKRGQAMNNLNKFIQDAFDQEGKYREKEYEYTPSKMNCMFCEFKNTEHCKVAVL